MDEGEIEEWEYPEPDPDDDETPDLVACPHCGNEIFEDAEQCPRCQQYLLKTGSAAAATTSLGWVGVLIIVLIVFFLLFGSLLGR